MKLLCTFCLCFITAPIFAQQAPEWFQMEVERKAGLWKSSNSLYQSEQEPYDHYLIEWVKGPEEDELLGQLRGLMGEDTSDVFWSYHQYYDPKTESVIIKTTGQDGTTAEGELIKSNDSLKLEQLFVSLADEDRREGHLVKIIDKHQERSTSYTINEKGSWIQNRTYLWIKLN